MPITKNIPLIVRLSMRELDQRFRDSMLGWFWAVISPLAMLAVFTLVFGVVFEARWQRPGVGDNSMFGFPILLFSGLILFNFLSDQINRSPMLIMENTSYVKKVLFPLEILPIVSMITSMVTMMISFGVFLVFYLIMYGVPNFTIFLLPAVLIPYSLFALGITYFMSSLGVFLRDLKHITPPLSTAMLFLSSVFYDPSRLPSTIQWVISLNPVTPAVNMMRDVVFWGRPPGLWVYLIYLIISLLVATSGYLWFIRTKKAFADVV